MGSFEFGKILTVLSLLVCVILSDPSVHVQSEITSQTVTVEKSGGSREVPNSVEILAVESGGKENEKEEEEEEEGLDEMPQPSHGHADQGMRKRLLGARDVDDDINEDDDQDGEETVQFMAVISERESQRPTPCSSFLQHQRPLTFDTITIPTTTPSLHYNPHSSTFIAPVNGLFLFSVKIQLRSNPQRRQLADVHIVTTETDSLRNVVCSISSQHGGARDLVDSLSRELNVEHRDDLNFATWDFEEEFQGRMRKNIDWDKAPRSVWKEVNPETQEVEGFCEGVKYLRQGQRVFVLIGNLDDKGNRKNVDDAKIRGDDKNVEDCEIVGGYFSGSLLTKDI